MNIKAVIDTNVLVSAFWTKNRESPTARILDAVLMRAFTPLYEQLNIGHTALSKAFRQMGIGSPAAFIRQEQFRYARRLLTQTQKPIAEIADEAGFISLTHFANVVKRLTGRTAREIRRSG